MPDLEAADIRALWKHFDANQDGVISKDEFREFMALSLKKQYGVELPLPPALIEEAFLMLDSNKGGTVDFSEFKTNINKYWSQRQQLVDKFYLRRADGSMGKRKMESRYDLTAPNPVESVRAPVEPVPRPPEPVPNPVEPVPIQQESLSGLRGSVAMLLEPAPPAAKVDPQLDELNKEILSLRDALSEANLEISRLNERLSRASVKAEETEKIRGDLEKVQEELKSHISEISRLQQEKANFEELRKNMEILESEKEAFLADVEKSAVKTRQISKDNQALKNQLDSANLEISSLKTSSENLKAEVAIAAKKLSAAAAEEEISRSRLSHELALSVAHVERLKEENEKLRASGEQTEKRKNLEIVTLEQERDEAQHQLEVLDAQIRNFQEIEKQYQDDRQKEAERFSEYRSLLKEKWRVEERKILALIEASRNSKSVPINWEVARGACNSMLTEIDSMWDKAGQFSFQKLSPVRSPKKPSSPSPRIVGDPETFEEGIRRKYGNLSNAFTAADVSRSGSITIFELEILAENSKILKQHAHAFFHSRRREDNWKLNLDEFVGRHAK